MFNQKPVVNMVVAIMLTLCAYSTASGQFFNGTNNTTSDIDRTGRVSIGSSTFSTGLQFLVTNGNIGQRQTTGVTFGGTSQGDLWTAIGGNPGVPNLPGLYGLKHQWGQYAINFQLQARSTTNPDTKIKDAVIAWNSSNGSGFGNGDLIIGNIGASNNFIPRMTFTDAGLSSIPGSLRVDNGLTVFNTMSADNTTLTGGLLTPGRLTLNPRIGSGSPSAFLEVNSGFTSGAALICGGLSFIPSGDNVRSLGVSGNRWSSVFAANGVIQTSDRREKENIQTLNYGLDHIVKLKPVTFKWKNGSEKGKIVGLIAQDVKEVIPEVVYDPATDIQKDAEGKAIAPDPNAPMGIRYSDLIPVLINAIKELNQIVEQQQETISQIKSEIGISENLVNGSTSLSTSKQLTVYQNTPNPSDESTIINYYVPETVQSAKLIIFNMNGDQKINRVLTNKGAGSVTISRSDLNPGMYFYLLIGDGQSTRTMRMIISN